MWTDHRFINRMEAIEGWLLVLQKEYGFHCTELLNAFGDGCLNLIVTVSTPDGHKIIHQRITDGGSIDDIIRLEKRLRMLWYSQQKIRKGE